MARRRPGQEDALSVAPRFRQLGLLAGTFFVAAIAMTGMPPLSGFIGKLLILDAARTHTAAVWVWALILGTSLIAIIGFGRAGSTLFWKSTGEPGSFPLEGSRDSLAHVAVGLLLACSVALTLFAGPVSRYLDNTAAQVFETGHYIETVIRPESDLEAGEAE